MKKLLAPNGNTSNLNDKQYKLVRTSAFKKWFGNWEVLAEAKTLSNDIKGVYKLVALNDVEQFLFEISQQANNSKSERSGAIETVGKRIVELALELFPNSKVGDEFISVVSKVVDDNGEPLIVWHGTKKEFTVFGKDKTKGINIEFEQDYLFRKNTNYFHTHKKYAKTFGSKYGGFEKPYFLNIKKIKLIDNETIEDIGYWKFIYDDYVNLGFDGVYSEDGQYATLLNPNQIKLADGSNTTFDANNDDIRYKRGGRTIAQTPAPKKERIYGSNTNKEKSSESNTSAKQIVFNDNTLKSIKNKVDKHNEENPDKLITLSSAKAVVRRGMGAYSLSHRPTIKGGKPNSRVAWGLARLNAFIYKVKNGVSKSGKYTQDDDLINDLNIKYNIGGDISDASYGNVKKDKLNYLDVLSNIWSNFNIKF